MIVRSTRVRSVTSGGDVEVQAAAQLEHRCRARENGACRAAPMTNGSMFRKSSWCAATACVEVFQASRRVDPESPWRFPFVVDHADDRRLPARRRVVPMSSETSPAPCTPGTDHVAWMSGLNSLDLVIGDPVAGAARDERRPELQGHLAGVPIAGAQAAAEPAVVVEGERRVLVGARCSRTRCTRAPTGPRTCCHRS